MRIPCTALAFALLSWTGPANAELLPAGPEFSVAATTSIARGGTSVDHFANGNVLAVWLESNGCCTDAPIQGRIYDADGVPTGPEFALGVLQQSGGSFLVRVVSPGDRFVVARTDGNPSVLAWRLYDGTGSPLGAEVAVSVAASTTVSGLATDANGDLAILYREYGAPNSPIKIQRYTMAGATVGVPTIVQEVAAGEQAVTIGLDQASDGHLLVAWVHNTAGPGNGSPTGRVRRYDTSGAAVGSDFAFTGPHDDGWMYGQLETDGAGHFYTSVSFIAGSSSIEENFSAVIRFDLDGSNPVEYAFESAEPSRDPTAMSAAPDGRLVVAWDGFVFADDGSFIDPYYSPHGWLMQYAADGTPTGPALPLTDRLYGRGRAGDVSVNANGSAFVAFTMSEVGMGNPPWIDARLQRYCDTDDAGCALCPAFDDSIDTDGDRIPDGCDPCSNVAGAQNAIVSKTSVGWGVEPRDMRVAFDETFVLPPGTTFADLSIVADGARLRVESARGQAMFDAVLPGGTYAGSGTRGWTASATKLKYTDRTDSPIEGVKRAMIVDQSRKQPGRVRVKARAGGGEYYSQSTQLPMTAIAVLGDATSAAAGVCGEFLYSAAQCEEIAWNVNRCLGVAE